MMSLWMEEEKIGSCLLRPRRLIHCFLRNQHKLLGRVLICACIDLVVQAKTKCLHAQKAAHTPKKGKKTGQNLKQGDVYNTGKQNSV
jgi:hypothetical protein